MKKRMVFVSVGISALDYFSEYNHKNAKLFTGDNAKDRLIKSLRIEEKNNKSDLYEHQKKHIIKILSEHKNIFQKMENDNSKFKLLTAELASLKAMEEKTTKGIGINRFTSEDIIFLIPTDTIEGKLCNDILMESFHGFIENIPVPLNIKYLNIEKLEILKKGLRNLKTRLSEKIKKVDDEQYDIYVNITGGLKGILPSFLLLANDIPTINIIYFFVEALEIVNLRPSAYLLQNEKKPQYEHMDI